MTRGGDGGDWSVRTAICVWYTPNYPAFGLIAASGGFDPDETLVSKAGNSGREKGYIASLYSLQPRGVNI